MLFVIELTYANEQIIPMVFSVLAAILIYVMWRWKWCYTFINFSNNWLNLDKYRCKHVHPLFSHKKYFIFKLTIAGTGSETIIEVWFVICYNHWSITKEMIVFYFKILDMCFQKKKMTLKAHIKVFNGKQALLKLSINFVKFHVKV